MIQYRVLQSLLCCCVVLGLVPGTRDADAHGGVVLDNDMCLIRMGYLKAHFKIYLPRTRPHEEFCEDVPEAAESVFVMEYMHNSLREMPIDFRIIRDVTGLGRYARWKDVALIDDLDGATVFYQPAAIEPDVFTIVQQFDEPGWYIGIVTTTRQDIDKTYTTVFPFKVGFVGLGYWPFLAALMILIQLHYWYMNGSFTKLREWRQKRLNAVAQT
jgi:hypothetical protein